MSYDQLLQCNSILSKQFMHLSPNVQCALASTATLRQAAITSHSVCAQNYLLLWHIQWTACSLNNQEAHGVRLAWGSSKGLFTNCSAPLSNKTSHGYTRPLITLHRAEGHFTLKWASTRWFWSWTATGSAGPKPGLPVENWSGGNPNLSLWPAWMATYTKKKNGLNIRKMNNTPKPCV